MVYHSGVSGSTKPQKYVTPISTLDPSVRTGGRLKFEGRVTLLALVAGFPAVALVVFLLWYDNYSGRVQWTVDLLLIIFWLGVAFNLNQRSSPASNSSNILLPREGVIPFAAGAPRWRRTLRSDVEFTDSANMARTKNCRDGSTALLRR